MNLMSWIMKIQHFSGGSVNKQDIYRTFVPIHDLNLQGKKGPNQNKKADNPLSNQCLLMTVIRMKKNTKQQILRRLIPTCPEVPVEETTLPSEIREEIQNTVCSPSGMEVVEVRGCSIKRNEETS